MKSKIYSSDYIKSSSKGRLWIPAFLILGFFMAFPVMELMKFGYWFGTENLSMEEIRKLYEELWVDGFMRTGFVVGCFGGAVYAIDSFWYLYSSRKTDFYHSLPVKRSGMFWHKAVIGILYYLVPYMIMEFLAICIGALRGFFSLKIVGMAVLMLLMHLLLYLMIYFSVVLVISVTGNLLMGALCLGGLYLYGPVLGCLLRYYRELFYDTSFGNASYGLLKVLEEYASPYLLGETFLENYSGGNYSVFLVIVLVVIGIFGILSYAAYVRHPSESAGKSIIYSWIGVVIKFMVVVPCGLGTGFIFLLIQYGDAKGGWWIFGLILGTILSHGIIEVMYQMDFRKFVSKKHHLALAGALVAVCAFTYHSDLFHFDAYIPEQKELAVLNLDFRSICWEGDIPIIKNEDGTYQAIGSWSSREVAMTKEDGVGAETWNVLNQIVAVQEKKDLKETDSRGNRKTGERYVLPVKYTLTSGREIYRQYEVTTQNLYDLKKALYEEGRLKEQNFSFLNIEPDCLENVQGSFINGEDYSLFQNDSIKYRELLDALHADLGDASTEDFLEQPLAELWLEYKLPSKIPSDKDPSAVQYSYWNGSVFVFPTFQRTLAILKETGYPMTIDEIEVDEVKITYDTEKDDDLSSVSVTYQKQEEIDALKKALVPSSLRCYWITYESGIAIEMHSDKNENLKNFYMGMRSNLVPDFVKEKKEEIGTGLGSTETEELLEAESEIPF